MSEPRTYHLSNRMALFCFSVDRFGLAKDLQRHGADIVVSEVTELEGRRW